MVVLKYVRRPMAPSLHHRLGFKCLGTMHRVLVTNKLLLRSPHRALATMHAQTRIWTREVLQGTPPIPVLDPD